MNDAIQKIRQFIAAGHEKPVVFSDTDDLLESGLVDSLRFVELVMLIAELSNREIAMDAIDIENFRTVENIWLTYFSSGPATAAFASIPPRTNDVQESP
ncbi:MAG: acyl carrier protein [Ramlibacter sp.]|nr:acyl carrier protein [Ramlibacter sp.]